MDIISHTWHQVPGRPTWRPVRWLLMRTTGRTAAAAPYSPPQPWGLWTVSPPTQMQPHTGPRPLYRHTLSSHRWQQAVQLLLRTLARHLILWIKAIWRTAREILPRFKVKHQWNPCAKALRCVFSFTFSFLPAPRLDIRNIQFTYSCFKRLFI